MNTKSNINQTKNKEDLRNTVISVKVSAVEKEQLQEMADEVELSVSELLRLKGLSKINKVASHEKALKEKEEEIKALKVALSFYDAKNYDIPALVLPMTERQKEVVLALFDNYYGDGKPVGYQIVHYLAEDILTTHFDLEKINITTHDGERITAFGSTRVEYPSLRGFGTTDFHDAFKEYGLIFHRDLSQVKLPKN